MKSILSNNLHECFNCKGTGQFVSVGGFISKQATCGICDGTGQVDKYARIIDTSTFLGSETVLSLDGKDLSIIQKIHKIAAIIEEEMK